MYTIYVHTRVCVQTYACMSVTRPCGPEIKNGVTRPDDLLRKVNGERDIGGGFGSRGGRRMKKKKKEKDIGEIRHHRRLRHIAELNK